VDGYGKRVLVADDDEDVRSIISMILSEAGYNVYVACDGLEAVEALKKRRYDAVLTDYHMPKMDGLELLDLVQAMWPEVPVILATSDTCLMDQAGGSLIAPAYALLDKPFDRSDLLNVIGAAISGEPKMADRPVRTQSSRAYQITA
jgi:CheY-like chemotaxis protein